MTLYDDVQILRAAHQGHLILFKMGDFHEAFFEDARTVSRVLSLTLTRRGKHEGADVPMAGFPYHMFDKCVQELNDAGVNVISAVNTLAMAYKPELIYYNAGDKP